MERVTLGIVGDPFVGKTLLCVSYTANYVYKDYKPTVLNHHWTNVIVDSHVVDLIIWDLPGSVSVIYSYNLYIHNYLKNVLKFYIRVFFIFDRTFVRNLLK